MKRTKLKYSWFSKLCSALRSGPGARQRRVRRLSFDRLERRNLLAITITGDFNGDGAEDLAIGLPNQNVGTTLRAGAVSVIYGMVGDGLTGTNNELWNQDTPGVTGVAETDDGFGAALAAGDFNGDGFDDLAMGVPQQDVSPKLNAGMVQILFGSAGGLTSTGNQLWHQGMFANDNFVGNDEQFGFAVAAGDFNNDGKSDLAIGVPGDGGVEGGVHVLRGSPTGLTDHGAQILRQPSGSIPGRRIGSVLAAGDLDCDDRDDLVIGSPHRSFNSSNSQEGAVYIFYRAEVTADTATFTQDSFGVEDDREPGDRFGAAVAIGDFSGDGVGDLAVGVPGEDIGSVVDAGAVHVLQGIGGTVCRVDSSGDQFWHQDSTSILDSAESEDFFGASLQAGDFNGDGRVDLAIGVPGETLESGSFSLSDAGAVNVLYGTIVGLTATGNQFWHQDSTDILGVIGPQEAFGFSLATGDFDGDTRADLAVNVSGEEICAGGRTEAINVIYGAVAGLTSADNQLWQQSTSGAFAEEAGNDLQIIRGTDALLIEPDGDLSVATAHFTAFDSFSPWGTNSSETARQRYQVADFNGDGLSDVIVFESDGAFNVWTAKATGGFNPMVRWGQNGEDIGTQRYKIGDFNGDGLSDIISFESNAIFYVWTAKVGGGFNDFQRWGWNNADIISRYQLGDFDGDGRTDVISFDANFGFYVWTAKPDGGFNPFQQWGMNGQDIGVLRYQIGDFNGDHLSDVISFEYNGGIYVWTANAAGRFNDFKRWGSNTEDILSVRYKLGDFNGDSRTDVISLELTGRFNVWTAMDGDRFTDRAQWSANGEDIGVDRYQLGDFNGDGRTDVGSFEANGGIYVWLAKTTVGFVNFTRWGSFNRNFESNRFLLGSFADPITSAECQ